MVLEQYLEQKNLTAKQVEESSPDLASSLKDYFTIKEMGGEEYKTELDKLGNELIAKLKEKEVKQEEIAPQPEVEITEGVNTTPHPGLEIETSEMKIPESKMELPEIPDIEIDVDDVTEIEQEVTQTESKGVQGYYVKDAELTKEIWMKILALGGFDYRYYRSKTGLDVFYWLGEFGWLITTNNPYEVNKMNIFIFSDNSDNLEKLYSLVQNKIIGFVSKEVATKRIGTENLEIGVDSDSNEPVTQIPYKLVDEAVTDIWKIGSMDELKELVHLKKKYACGCGSI